MVDVVAALMNTTIHEHAFDHNPRLDVRQTEFEPGRGRGLVVKRLAMAIDHDDQEPVMEARAASYRLSTTWSAMAVTSALLNSGNAGIAPGPVRTLRSTNSVRVTP